MPRVPGLARRFPWLMAVEAGRVAHQHWNLLTASERSRLSALIRKSKGRLSNLTPRERADLRRLAAKLDLLGAGRKMMPFGGGLRRKR
jgi:hypothetical protein